MMKPENDWLATEHFKGTKLPHLHRAIPHDKSIIHGFQDCDFMAVKNVSSS